MNTIKTLKKLILLSLVSLFGITHPVFLPNEGFNDSEDEKMYQEQKETYKKNMIREALKDVKEIISKVDGENNGAINHYYTIFKANNPHLDKNFCLIVFLRRINNYIVSNKNQSPHEKMFMLIKNDETFKKFINMLDKDVEDFIEIKKVKDTFKYGFFNYRVGGRD